MQIQTLPPTPNTRSSQELPRERFFSRHQSLWHNSNLVNDAYKTRFLEQCSGRDVDGVTPESNAYLLHLKSLSDGRWTAELDAMIHPEYKLLNEPFEKTTQLCAEVAALLREYGGISIVKLAQRLQLKSVFREDQKLCNDPLAQSLIFSSLGWLSLLYIPTKRARANELKITIQGTKSTIRSVISAEMAARPLGAASIIWGPSSKRAQEVNLEWPGLLTSSTRICNQV